MTEKKTPHATGSTTQAGIPAVSDRNSLTVGNNGPIVLHDHHLVETLAHFNRMNVPERRPHAKGSGAFGTFEVTEDVSQYTKADFLQPGKKTEMLARFSTVAGELGSPDTWRDVRGFALKFYTDEGNFDMVGNNTPIFFVRDPMKFPHFIRSQKRLPDSGLRDGTMQWDFWTQNPESAHQVTYLMGDRGLPKTWRHMNGYSSHTYSLVNEQGERFWVKWHFISNQGTEELSNAEAEKLAGADAEFHRRDLFEAIQRGEHPSWDLYFQVMPYEEAKNYRFNPFDLTKIWSKKDYPRIKVGYFELNRNPENYHNQIEQIALDPSNLVPGVGFSPDKMLQGRIFAYADQQRYRIGPNYRQLPVNRPVNGDVNTYSHKGPMAYEHNAADAPVYSPNGRGKGAGYLDDGVTSNHGDYFSDANDYGEADDAMVGLNTHGDELYRGTYVKHAEDGDFVQPGILYREVMNDQEKEELANNIAGAMVGVSPDVEERCYWYWSSVDENLGKRVKEIFATKKDLPEDHK